MSKQMDWLTLSEAAKEYGIKMATLRRACWAGRLPASKRANTWFVQRADLERFASEFRPRERGGEENA